MIEILDNGKPIREIHNIDISMTADYFRYFADGVRTEESRAVMLNKKTRSLVVHKPLSVVRQIIF